MTNSRSGKSAPAANRTSLSRRLTRLVVPSLGVLIVVGGFALHSAMKSLLVSQFDRTLLLKARTITRLAGDERTGINLGFTENPLPEFETGEKPEYFQVWLNNGSVLAKSPSLPDDQELPRLSGTGNPIEFLPLTLPDGRAGRAVALRLGSQERAGGEPFVVDLTLARSSEDLKRILRQVVLGVVGGGTALLILAWILVRRATGLALRPVDELARNVGAIDADSLKSRINNDALPIDLQPIGEQINQLMGRIDAAFARERRFASNAAHELLTPVTELRVAADNALDWPDDPRATTNLAADACELSEQMEHVVRSLLALSRAEAHLTPLHLKRFDLVAMIRDLLASRAEDLSSGGLQLQCDLPDRIDWTSDEVIVRSILNNLLSNAVEYSTPGTMLEISGRIEGNAVAIVVKNQPERIHPDDIERFTEAFWRGDSVRTSREHAGLGLALSRAFARLLNGTLEFSLEDDRTVVALLRLPDMDAAADGKGR